MVPVIRRTRSASMRQGSAGKIPPVEVGFTLCRRPSGVLTRGPAVSGTRTAVNIPLLCPPGSSLEGLFHTHPGGVAFPSQTDKSSARKFDAKVLCITNDTQTRCFRVTGRRGVSKY